PLTTKGAAPKRSSAQPEWPGHESVRWLDIIDAMGAQTRDERRTEQRLAASRNLDRMSAIEIVRLMNGEDRKVAVAVGRESVRIARAVDAIVTALRGRGRLFYVGAGSSGRMAVLDAAEVPPTFGISRRRIVALIAGGRRAVTGAVEGAEDAVLNAA